MCERRDGRSIPTVVTPKLRSINPVTGRLRLSGAVHESGNDAGPSVSDLAEKITALKAAHSIEATPQRTRQKQSSAEEPATARIRRRTEAIPAADQGIQRAICLGL
jgi:hypothetical protein